MWELMQDYTLRQVSSCQRQIAELERKRGMNFTKFTQYLHERGAMLQSKELSLEQRQSLGRALMAAEDDWLIGKQPLKYCKAGRGFERGGNRKVLESADRYQENKKPAP